ncbi:HEXXH motif domain-containing protein [Streptomyces sp. NPDC001816]|uniref:HEXXH motif domain-containing protein n=1 Tax=Streptomyces sp. NPDC001816 TaxID=3364612 RepID=UPI0036923B5E
MSDDGPVVHGAEAGSDSGQTPTGVPRHRLTVPHLQQLAHGGGGRDAVAALRTAQRSRRLVLLRALVETVDQDVPPDAPWPSAQTAWDLLAEAEAADRAAVEAVLLHPPVGSWLARVLRGLRADAASAPEPEVWQDAAQIHALAAAAALAAGIPFRARVPALGTGVLFPSLGWAVLPSAAPPPAEPVVEAFRDDHGAGVRCHTGTVRLPDDLGGDAPGWWAIRRLRATHAGVSSAPALEDLDPWRHYLRRMPVERLGEDEVSRWRELYRAAWRHVAAQHRVDPGGVADCLLALTPLPDRSPADLFSGSAPESYGGFLMSRPSSALDLAAALVHEAQHIKLSALLDLVTLLRGGLEETHYAPWRADPRPLRGILQGVYAFLGVASFWQALREGTGLSDAERAQADFEFALRRGQVEEGLRTLWSEASLTDLGEHCLRAMEHTLTALLKEPVPAAAGQAAEEARDDHRTVFRLSQLTCDPDRVRAWADAFEGGRPPPHRYPEVRPLTGPPTPEVRTRLMRIRFGDPERFARLREDPPTLAGASVPDYAWAAGDRAAALAGYRRLVAEDPADPVAWAGLGLSLPEGRARDALLHRPELVAALHRELLRRGMDQGPETVAAWTAMPSDGVTVRG